MKNRVFILALFLALVAGSDAQARKRNPASEKSLSLVELLSFRFGMLGGIQTTNQWAITGSLAWTPRIQWSPDYYLKPLLGAFIFKNSDPQQSLFLAMEAQLLVGLKTEDGYFEFGGGLQNWPSNGGIQPTLSLGVLIPMGDNRIGPIDGMYLTYSAYYGSPQMSSEIRLGFEVNF